MSETNKSTPAKKVLTILTSPIWVPAAAIGGLVSAPVRAIDKSIDKGKATEGTDADKVAEGIGSLPGNLVGKVVTGPFEFIGKAGKELWGSDD